MKAQKQLVNLRARPFPGGRRVDLTWGDPEDGAPGDLIILRSVLSYPIRPTDQAIEVYNGPWINAFTDGVAGYGSHPDLSGSALDEGRFYYYTLFYKTGTDPYLTNQTAMVCGLSLRDYYARYGHYVYNLLPSNVRALDAVGSGEGKPAYLLRDYCEVLQASVNLYRGWAEALANLRNPELAPAGKIGVASGQTDILGAILGDLSLNSEQGFDNGVLRRLAFGMMDVYKLKGTCPGLVLFASLLCRWTVRCDDAVDPECGVQGMFSLWDTEAYKVVATETTSGDMAGTATGYTAADGATLTFDKSLILNALETAPSDVPDSDDGPTVAFVIDAMGTWACISRVDRDGDNRTLTLERGFLRAAIPVSGTNGVNSYTVTSNPKTHSAWQFAAPAGTEIPRWGPNAWNGYKFKDSAGSIFDIITSAHTNGLGQTVLTLSGSPAGGDGYIAWDFDGSQAPVLRVWMYVGNHSLLISSRWDARLAGSINPGPYASLLTLVGSSNVFGNVIGPGDVTLIVKGIGSGKPAEDAGTATAVTASTLTDSAKAWTVNEWADYYLLPNWNQSKVFKVLSNTPTALTVETPAGDVNDVSEVTSHYVIMTEENAIKYVRLIQMAKQLVPDGTRVFVKFES